MRYLFQLGHQPLLSRAEIIAVLNMKSIKYKPFFDSSQYYIIQTDDEVDVNNIMKILGGTVKISVSIPSEPNTIKTIVSHLCNIQPKGKVVFSLSGDNSKYLALKVKKNLTELSRSARFIIPKSTATIIHNKLIKKEADLTVVNNDVYATLEVQPIEEFSARDVERPKIDIKSGVLPPKLARILINLSEIKPDVSVLLDPFCGSGTILTEGLSLGFKKLIGTDVSEKAISDSKKNVAWMKDYLNLKGSPDIKIELSDVRGLLNIVEDKPVNAIVTEPYLGKLLKGNETSQYLKKQASELANLYFDAFNSFKSILKPNGVIVIILPAFHHHKTWVKTSSLCLDRIKKLGFEVVPFFDNQNSIMYWRKGQYVGREIWKFIKI